jgi:hypothetical protein
LDFCCILDRGELDDQEAQWSTLTESEIQGGELVPDTGEQLPAISSGLNK